MPQGTYFLIAWATKVPLVICHLYSLITCIKIMLFQRTKKRLKSPQSKYKHNRATNRGVHSWTS